MTTKVEKTSADIRNTANHYRVTTANRSMLVYTNANGNGLWVNGQQVEGTCDFSAGKNPAAKIRRYFKDEE